MCTSARPKGSSLQEAAKHEHVSFHCSERSGQGAFSDSTRLRIGRSINSRTILHGNSLMPFPSCQTPFNSAVCQALVNTFQSADTPAAAADLVTDEDEGKCEAPEKCGLCTCSDEQVPLSWKQKPIEDFVDRRHADLMRNPPGYTEYQGGPIWDALQHQLFRLQQQELQQNYQGDARTCGTAAKLSLILSGMQSNISALAGEYYYSNFSQLHQQSEQQDAVETPLPPTPAPSVSFFLSRFARHPERLQSLFFTFAFILKGVCRLTDVLQECSCETGNTSDDLPARAELLQVLNATASQLSACNSKYQQHLFKADSPLGFLESAESIESLLRCVSCEKCQLHGTIKLTALRLAAKVCAS
ncbi:endoplasmic reticulum [Cyclospora cayetanensis]|uniref:Endoplasmic reticulum n=1 Tax=Cyclospora cayetanensis TaxID=88456 RepID=A0A1D3D7S7_9EIME|nr:endoplasmic reticulum [Cyclospora cayetanensis]